jgi:serine/threonine-protein kinase RsbW
MRLPNRPEFVAVARLAVSAVATRMDFDIEAIEDLKVAVGEALNNAIEHGCPTEGGDEMISLRCELEPEALVIIVRDCGDGFDPATAMRQHPDDSVTLSERGLGMFLIEALMDEVDFTSLPGNGTQVRMLKRRRATEEEHS